MFSSMISVSDIIYFLARKHIFFVIFFELCLLACFIKKNLILNRAC